MHEAGQALSHKGFSPPSVLCFLTGMNVMRLWPFCIPAQDQVFPSLPAIRAHFYSQCPHVLFDLSPSLLFFLSGLNLDLVFASQVFIYTGIDGTR